MQPIFSYDFKESYFSVMICWARGSFVDSLGSSIYMSPANSGNFTSKRFCKKN